MEMSSPRLAYEIPYLAQLVNSFPRFDLSLRRVNATFLPDSHDYKESLVMWCVSPLIVLLAMLLACLFFLCFRCFRRERSKKRPVPCVHWSIYLLALISCISLGVGYYGNREAEKGLESTLEAVVSATETIQRIHNLNQQLTDKLNATRLLELNSLWRYFAANNLVLDTLDDIASQIRRVLEATVAVEEQALGVDFSVWNQHSLIAQEISYYRWMAVAVGLTVCLALCLSLFIAVARLSKCMLMLFCVGGTLSLVVCWIFTGTHVGAGLIISDFCVEPDAAVYRMGSSHEEILSYYITCDHKLIPNPFVESLMYGLENLNTAKKQSHQLVMLAANDRVEPQIYAMAYSVEQELNSTLELLVHVMSSVECSSLHQDYITGLNMLCNKALPGIALVTVALASEAVLFSFLVILAAVAARNVIRVSGAHGIASAAKRSALKNFTNSRIVSGLLKGNRLPDVQQLQKSMKLLKLHTAASRAPT